MGVEELVGGVIGGSWMLLLYFVLGERLVVFVVSGVRLVLIWGRWFFTSLGS